MAEPEPTKLDTTKSAKPRKTTNGTVSPIKKTVAKKAPAKKVAEKVLKDAAHPYYTRSGYTPAKDCQLYEAVGGSGQIAVRSSREPYTHGIDVSDTAGRGERAKQGQVWAMYTSKAEADTAADRLREQGLVVKVVPAKPYRGQPGDKKVKQ